jgi:hypothetical protein
MKERKFLYMLRRGETCKRLFISTAAPHGQQEEKRRRKETHTHTQDNLTHTVVLFCVCFSLFRYPPFERGCHSSFLDSSDSFSLFFTTD